jgi:hypothetical protein
MKVLVENKPVSSLTKLKVLPVQGSNPDDISARQH